MTSTYFTLYRQVLVSINIFVPVYPPPRYPHKLSNDLPSLCRETGPAGAQTPQPTGDHYFQPRQPRPGGPAAGAGPVILRTPRQDQAGARGQSCGRRVRPTWAGGEGASSATAGEQALGVLGDRPHELRRGVLAELLG